jgi:hypothetical protein
MEISTVGGAREAVSESEAYYSLLDVSVSL